MVWYGTTLPYGATVVPPYAISGISQGKLYPRRERVANKEWNHCELVPHSFMPDLLSCRAKACNETYSERGSKMAANHA